MPGSRNALKKSKAGQEVESGEDVTLYREVRKGHLSLGDFEQRPKK